MKTKTNMSRIAKTGLVALAALLISFLSPAQANFDKVSYEIRNHAKAFDFETQAAFDRLEVLASSVEASVEYVAPSVTEDVKVYELQAAKDRLEDLSLTIGESIRYQASMVNEEAEAYELAAAKERLENMSLAIEESIRFYAPAAQDEIMQDKIEYVNNGIYTIPVSDLAMNLLTR